MLASLNLWDPSHLTVALIIPTAFLLGMVHGVTPDEHTWPITFSYSIGSYSSKGGRKAGFLFSAAFTLQRAIAAEIAYFALDHFELGSRWGFEVYIVVGAVMLGSGLFVLRRGGPRRVLGSSPGAAGPEPRTMPGYMPVVHGFIAGWGVGAFAVIIYTVLAPGMGSPWLGWVPGALFGLGTMVMQILLGSIFGGWMARRKLPEMARAYIARMTAARTLAGGGIGFMVVAVVGLAMPSQLARISVVTPIKVHNLHQLDFGFFLAVIVLFSVAVWALRKSSREARALVESAAHPASS